MSDTNLMQRLAAIFAADAAGYSRLMAEDELATVNALDAAREIFRRQIEANQGRVIDMAGDSVLAVFNTASGAVSAALAVQQEIDTAGLDTPAERALRFRIGVHLGDVIEKTDGTVYGDGVNIAARLEGLAEPGGVTVSDSIRGAVKGRVSAAFEDLGEQTVKNIADPVHAYRVQADGGPSSQTTAVTKSGLPDIDSDLPLPDKPSIAVLPFTNMSGDPEQEYFIDGVTEDIITELSRFRALFVIARNSSFTYKGKAHDVRVVARELGVRYVLEGSIRRAGNRIRVTAQLVDAVVGNHLWAEKYDRVIEDAFAVQEDVTRAIVVAIAPHIDSSELKRVYAVRPGNLSAYEMALRGYAAARASWSNPDRSALDEALRIAREVVAIDPLCGLAWRTITLAQGLHVYFNTATSVPAAVEEGLAAARNALAIDNGDHLALQWKGTLLLLSGEPEVGRADIQRAYELNPNDVTTLSLAGVHADDPRKGIQFTTEALRLSPRDPFHHALLNNLAWAYFSGHDYAKGAETAQRAIGEAPNQASSHVCLILNWVGLGEVERAQSAFPVWRNLAPGSVDARLAGEWMSLDPGFRQQATAFLRIAAGLEDPGAADGLR